MRRLGVVLKRNIDNFTTALDGLPFEQDSHRRRRPREMMLTRTVSTPANTPICTHLSVRCTRSTKPASTMALWSAGPRMIADQDCCKTGDVAPAVSAILCDFADGVFRVGTGDLHRADLFVLEVAQAKSSGTRQE